MHPLPGTCPAVPSAWLEIPARRPYCGGSATCARGIAIRAQIKRWLKITFGVIFVVLGIAGLFLPFLQGILFLAIGISLLASEIYWVRIRVERARARYPKAAHTLDRAEDWLRRYPGRASPWMPPL